MEASQVLTQGSLNAIFIERLIFRGIDNHEITASIPIVTAGAVARSQPGMSFF
jgi:hypothetical protein